ncbi:MAG TPA: RdgB/HAM1 family non-canonical purine NTP pyrophosphatase [Bacteriovoracaceae bacterium]|nr:RdgB/HAM1 family non-canonical purine NTP pyrophosphatase [Bacteriovoracaceae bacterium]
MTSLILASGNAHKAQEFKELLSGLMTITAAPKSLEVDETGSTFTENAFLKAEAYYKTFKVPALADDSGLTIEALPDILGVHSARFAPELKTYPDKNRHLLEMMEKLKSEDRRACFTCVLCFYFSPDEVFFFEGRVHGNIGKELKGEGGFGYDPIFIPERKEADGKSLAELPEWKNEFSHRAKAVQSALQFFKESIDKIGK